MEPLHSIFLALGAAVGVFVPEFLVVLASHRSSVRLFIEGDIIIGGLIPVHFSPNFAQHPGVSSCKGAIHLRGYKGVEAMLYAVDLINNNHSLLPNITLGVDIKDTCGSVDYAIMESLNFDFIRSAFPSFLSAECAESKDNVTAIRFPRPGGETLNGSISSQVPGTGYWGGEGNTGRPVCCSKGLRTAAIVGAAFSGVTMATASLAGLFHVPVVSFASSSRLLSDKSRFRYVFRTVPSDTLQAQAVADLLGSLRWHFIITLASDNEYGRSGITTIKQTIHNQKEHRICIVVDELFSRKGSREDMQNIFTKIKTFPMAKVIILYSEFPDARYFFEEAQKASLRDYLFIASDSWVGSTSVTQGSEQVFHSIIGLRPPIAQTPHFDLYFTEKLRRNQTTNPWIDEFEKTILRAKNKSDACYSEVHDDGYIPYIMDAVFSIAHALHAMLNCSERACSNGLSDVKIRDLSQFLQNVSFPGYSQTRIEFNQDGCVRGQYDIYYMQIGADKYVKIGYWNDHSFQRLNLSHISLAEVPTSICSKDCKKGEFKIPKSEFPECCWECAMCEGRSYTNTSHTTNCLDCPKGTWPTADHTGCSPIKVNYLQWSESWAVVIAILSVSGLATVFLTVVTFVRFRETAVVRAASSQLCYFLLSGIAMFYVTPLPYVVKPSSVSCKILPFMIGLCFVLVVGTILIRTNRVSRIFNEKLLRTGTISCFSNHWQLLILGCMLTTELVVCLVWVYSSSSSPFPEVIYHQASKDASLVCNLSGSDIGFSLWLIYNAGLIVVCTYQAFLVRKVPQNYNESKLIAFNMTTICVTVLVYIPSYLGTSGWYRTVISSLMFMFLGTLTWASIFAPKIYIILFRPHKNVPMRPSVSSITLGVITPSPTVVSNLSDQSTCSRANSFMANGACVFSFDKACNEQSDGFEGRANPANDEDENEISWKDLTETRRTSPVRFEIGEPNSSENELDYIRTENSADFNGPKGNYPRSNDSPSSHTAKPCEIYTGIIQGTSRKKISVVHFEDEIPKNNLINQNKPCYVRKQSNGTQGGILRKKESYTGGEVDKLGVSSPNKEMGPTKKKRTSLVRFQDEEVGHVIRNREISGVLTTLAKDDVLNDTPPKETNCIEGIEENKGGQRETDQVPDKTLPNAAMNGSVNIGRKRKMSVYSFG